MSPPVIPVVLSGGAGSRLWPLSRQHHPKQLIALLGERTLLQTTVERLARLGASLGSLRAPVVVCNDAHRFMLAEQLGAVGVTPAAIVLEPVARSTAPAVAAAAFEALAQCDEDEEPILLVLPADHDIRDGAQLAGAVRAAVREAAGGKLVTFGVAPACPETGYGYIKSGAPTGLGGEACVVDGFVEKPDAEEAAAWLETGGYWWNSGMFVFGASRYLHELGTHAQPVRDAVQLAHENAVRDLAFLRLDAGMFAESPSVSVDHAIMEHTASAVMVPLNAGWSDIGSWTSLATLLEQDASGNTAQGDVVLEGTRNTCVLGGDRVVAAVGVTDCVIVDTADAVLVAGKGAVQDIRKVVAQLEGEGRDECKVHRKVYRPWGSYDVLHGGDGFKVKHIAVNPGKRLSLQMHHHRAEHWIVVRGIAQVTRGDETFIVRENESTYIPRRTRHRIENPGTMLLEVIEVQSGSYLGEDDIVRFEDAYGRVDHISRKP